MTTETMREAVARAIYEATDPLSGDAIATLIHISDHLFWHGVDAEKEMTDLERQLEAVRIVCRAAADAAIRTVLERLREPTISMLEVVDDDDDDKYVARGRAIHSWKRMLDAAVREVG